MKQYICDGCKTVGHHPYAGWVNLEILDRTPQRRVPLHFCGVMCLAAHAEHQLARQPRSA